MAFCSLRLSRVPSLAFGCYPVCFGCFLEMQGGFPVPEHFICRICRLGFSSPHRFAAHLWEHFGRRPGLCPCCRGPLQNGAPMCRICLVNEATWYDGDDPNDNISTASPSPERGSDGAGGETPPHDGFGGVDAPPPSPL